MPKNVDISGQKFNFLTAIKQIGYDNFKHQKWLFKCECGKEVILIKNQVTTGHTKSCGCKTSFLCAKANTTHGHTRNRKFTKEYSTWSGMKQRCFDKNNSHYKNYGGNGIIVCDRWLDFENFLSDIGKIPNNYSLERINVKGNYCPENCTLIPLNMQRRNTTKNLIVTYKGDTDCLINLCEKYNKNYNLVYSRIYNGWGIEEAFELEKGKKRWIKK